MEKTLTKAVAVDALKQIATWATEYPSYLSEKTEYARGYKEGILIAKQIVKDLLEEYAGIN